MEDKLKAQIADPGMLLLWKQYLNLEIHETYEDNVKKTRYLGSMGWIEAAQERVQ